ncbi:hypothetical protein PVAP13_7KG167130 [Panicum virgatum]|uniref:F-box domain-containing protein n=1 Tax=Panicum virgatum TaxID=38727 RepID=A0A8T0QHL2_PANVG|nr:hypothetical protein PVAP13_7KG167130 [Panicum virgatum]
MISPRGAGFSLRMPLETLDLGGGARAWSGPGKLQSSGEVMVLTMAAAACGRRRPAGMEDRLSSLPDDLLHIMSFLTSRQAVQTCVLSRRWVGHCLSHPEIFKF